MLGPLFQGADVALKRHDAGQLTLEPARVVHAVIDRLALVVLQRGQQVGDAGVKGHQRVGWGWRSRQLGLRHIERDRQKPVLALSGDLGRGGCALEAALALEAHGADARQRHRAVPVNRAGLAGHGLANQAVAFSLGLEAEARELVVGMVAS